MDATHTRLAIRVMGAHESSSDLVAATCKQNRGFDWDTVKHRSGNLDIDARLSAHLMQCVGVHQKAQRQTGPDCLRYAGLIAIDELVERIEMDANDLRSTDQYVVCQRCSGVWTVGGSGFERIIRRSERQTQSLRKGA